MSNYLNLEMGGTSVYYDDESNNPKELTMNDKNRSDAMYITSNLNIFYDRMYNYYYQGGIRNIILNIGLNISILIITNLFIMYTFAYINWNDIIVHCKHKEDICEHLSDFIDYSNSIHPIIIIYLIMTTIYALIYLFIHISRLVEYRYIRNFYNNILDINNEYLNIVRWEIIIDKMKTAQKNKKIMIERFEKDRELDEYSILSRITQYNNIIVSMVNSNILFKRTNLSRNILFTQYIENITRNRIFNYIIDIKNTNISIDAKQIRIKNHIIKVMIINTIFLPFIFMFMLTYYILKSSKDINNKQDMFLNKRWTNYAHWTFRAYNEVDIDFDERMHRSHTYMNRYINCFPSKTLNCIFYFFRFFLSAFLLFIISISFIDENALLDLKFLDFNLLWYFAILTIITAGLNNVLKNDSFKYSRDDVVKNLAKYTYVLPPNDIINNYRLYKSFIKHYKTNIENILYEVFSILISPYILYKCYYVNSDDILEYIENNTTTFYSQGTIDNYSNFSKEIQNENTVLYRKREKSFVAFKSLYPEWKKESNDLTNYLSELTKYDEENDFPSMYASEIYSSNYNLSL